MKLEKWMKAVPESKSHGSGSLQKRLWQLTSDFVRIRDWYAYKGLCIATNRRIMRWKDGDAGHFRPYSVCRGMFKFDERNVFLQSKRSNGFGEYDDWINFEANIFLRTRQDKASLDKLNLTFELKVNDFLVIEKMKDILGKMEQLQEKPEYYERVVTLLNEDTN